MESITNILGSTQIARTKIPSPTTGILHRLCARACLDVFLRLDIWRSINNKQMKKNETASLCFLPFILHRQLKKKRRNKNGNSNQSKEAIKSDQKRINKESECEHT